MRVSILIFMSSIVLWGCNSGQESVKETPASTPAETTSIAVVDAATKPSTACELTVGWTPYEPYQFDDLDGNVRGMDIELVSLYAKKAECNVTFVYNEWIKLLRGLQAGEVHVMLGATRTEEREKFAYFSAPYRSESFAVFVRSDEVDKWNAESLEEMVRDKKMRIGLVDGYVYGGIVNDLLDNPDYNKLFISAPFSESHAAGLLDNKVDGMLEDPYVAAAVIKRKHLSQRLQSLAFKMRTGDVSLMYSQKSVTPEIVKRFDAAIASTNASGEFDAIVQRYRK